jgi:lysozyme family protein
MFEALKSKNAKRWETVKVTRSYPSIVKRILVNKARYQSVEAQTGVPWPVIAVIHVREADQNFNTQLAQGDPLSRVSTHVPRGQGPYPGPNAWANAAARALKDEGGPSWKDWSPGGWTTFVEKYNGLGYSRMGRPSPYVWAGTNQYVSGKYVSDGKYDSGAVDSQPGCASLILQVAKQDPTVNPDDLTPGRTVHPAVTSAVVAGSVATGTAVSTMHHWGWLTYTLTGLAVVVSLVGIYLIYKHFKGKS